jgi:hypothetical protein
MKKNLKRKKGENRTEHKMSNIILNMLFFSGILLTIWEIDIYQKTLIDWQIPFSIWIITGLITIPLFRKYLIHYYETTHILLQLVFTIVGLGGIALFLFMGINRYVFLDQKETIVVTEISKKGKLEKSKYGGISLHVDVKIADMDKKLIFPDKEETDYDSVEVKFKRGILGFDIITAQKLLTKSISTEVSFIQNQKLKYNFALVSCDTCVPISNIGWRVMVELNEKEEKIVKNLNRATWIRLLKNIETDWSANLMLYYIYNRDAILLKQNKDIIVWKKYAKADDLEHWNTVLKD